MYTADLLDMIQSRIAEQFSSSTFFGVDEARSIIYQKQLDMSERIKCLESYAEITIGSQIYGDTKVVVSNLSIYGLTDYNSNFGKLYWNCTLSGGVYTFNVYKDYAKSSLVASGTTTSATGHIALTSTVGIGGTLTISYSEDDTESTNYILAPRYYDLPVDFLEPLKVIYNDNTTLGKMDFEPQSTIYPTGAPQAFFLKDKLKLGLYPAPSEAGTLKLWYVRKTPEFAFRIKHNAKYNNATIVSATLVSTATDLNITTVISSATTVSKTFTYEQYPTVSDIVNIINNNASIACTCVISPTINTRQQSTSIEVMDDVAIEATYGKLYTELELPSEMHYTLLDGVVDAFREKDREYASSGKHFNKYNADVDRFASTFKERRNSIAYDSIKNAYGNMGLCGNTSFSVYINP